ncbi:MAG: hypothetical protein WAL80_09095, partial [Xanthobacteraceae bacterium]
LAQIKGISSGHPMLASIPASILNHIRAGSGIPFDSEKISHALAFCLSMIFSENRFPLFRIMLCWLFLSGPPLRADPVGLR